MDNIVEQALPLWNLHGSHYALVARRENHVYRIDSGRQSYALRIHRQDFRSDAALRSELQWMAALQLGGMEVPTPVYSLAHEYLVRVGCYQIDLLEWMPGSPMGKSSAKLDVVDRIGLHKRLGQNAARLHALSDQWAIPPDFERWAWDCDGLLGDAPLWGRFWDNPTLSAAQQKLLLHLRLSAKRELLNQANDFDYGLIHADLARENILIDGNDPIFIDFDDGGYGYRLFELSTILFRSTSEPDYEDLKAALIEGYHEIRPLDTQFLNLFILLRAATYVGWIVPRMHEADAEIRNARYIQKICELAERYL